MIWRSERMKNKKDNGGILKENIVDSEVGYTCHKYTIGLPF